MKPFKKCTKCNSYTLKDICPKCNAKTDNPLPAKYSPDDKYGSYRRTAKAQLRNQEGKP
jgi:H/ACA ribonucleoprotein complex subunit 3|tara:strand:+ start:424 stop:600 length:177 start_codon:yes stop_codon:yes gene_type:complete